MGNNTIKIFFLNRGHSRHLCYLASIFSDGYPPLPTTAGASSTPAGMTEGGWAPADSHGYDGYGMDIRLLEHDE